MLLTVEATWRQKPGTSVVGATTSADFAFSDVNGSVSVSAPSDLWTYTTSRRYAYRMAYPVGWLPEKGSKKYADTYYGLGGTAVYAASGPSLGLTLRQVSNALTKYLPGIKGVKRLTIDHSSPARLGSLPARLVEFHYGYKGRRYWSVAYLAVTGGLVYLMSYETITETTAADREMAATFAGTFTAR